MPAPFIALFFYFSSFLIFQCWVRRAAAKRRVAAAANAVIVRCQDGSSGVDYYYNARTGKTSWTRPAVLVSHDWVPYKVYMDIYMYIQLYMLYFLHAKYTLRCSIL
jgi:hypothetical protein